MVYLARDREFSVPTERIRSDIKMVHLWDVANNTQEDID